VLNYNGYTYCLNNPLRYTDPTGYSRSAIDWSLQYSSVEAIFSNNYVDYWGQIQDAFSNMHTYEESEKEKEKKKKEQEQKQEFIILNVPGIPFPFLIPKTNQSNTGKDRETLAWGGSFDGVLAVGPIGLGIEVGGFKYKGEYYLLLNIGHALGLELSGGINAINIRGYKNSFSPYDLSEWSTTNSLSLSYFTFGREVGFIPTVGTPTTQYRNNIEGLGYGALPAGFSHITGYTWIWKIRLTNR
jgi:hypothetical protein